MQIVRRISTLLIIYACIGGDLLCNGAANCTDRSDEDSKLCSRIGWLSFLQTVRPLTETIRPSTVQTSRRIRSPVTSAPNTCIVLPRPQNGQWKLHRSQCSSGQECNVTEGTKLGLGSHLVVSCNSGYKIRGPSDVFCVLGGQWHNIPDCVPEIRCKSLTTASVEARCSYDDDWVFCESPVLPRTKAELQCRIGYYPTTYLLSRQKRTVICNANGQWEPEPMRCIPVCGNIPHDIVSWVRNKRMHPNGEETNRPNITEFPWHASLYRIVDEQKRFFCGATIIQEKLLITAAHCVYDEKTMKLLQAKSIYVLTGNIFRDYDYPDDQILDQLFVGKNQVKRIYIRREYRGLERNYLQDIAILELVRPFVLSTWLVPVCIETPNYGNVGSFGKVVGFDRTAHSESSAVLQVLTVFVIPLDQCRSASQNAKQYITSDKFCAVYTNGSSICDCHHDSGSGLVYKTNGLWYLGGIVSFSLGTIQESDENVYYDNLYYDNLYSYTDVSRHISWIQDVVTKIEQNQIHALCSDESQTKCSFFAKKYSHLHALGFF